MRYKSKHNLLRWFLEPRDQLPASYVKSCEEFFKSIKQQAPKFYSHPVTGDMFEVPSSEAQATSVKLDKLPNEG